MKKIFVPVIMALMLFIAPVMASAAEFVGTIQGLTCVTQGKVCPVGKEDAVIAAENVFVLLVDAAKGEYYFLPSLDRGILARHINETLKVVGDMDQTKAKSIAPSEIFLMKDNKWTEVWNKEWQNSLYKDLEVGIRSGGTN